MVQSSKIEVKFFASGYCTAHARVVSPKSGRGMMRFYAVWTLIKHPELGILLFDAGYNSDFFKVTKKWPERLYRWATPVILKEEETAKEILAKEGIAADDVNYFVISHFHGDHICALNDFPSAKFLCTAAALKQVKELNGFSAVRKGILKKLLPIDFFERVVLLENIYSVSVDSVSKLKFYVSIHHDGLRFVELPGHARGMIGFYLKTEEQDLLYATDAAWDKHTFLNRILPSPIVKLFFDSWKDFKQTNENLLKFLKANPKTEILFTHCPQTLKHVENAF